MVCRRAVLAFFLVQSIAFAAAAQESGEFGRASGGVIVMTPKGASPLSGSLELSTTDDLTGRGTSAAYGMTLGGTLIEDRLWFFASGSRQEGSRVRFADLELPENATAGAIGARLDGHVGDAHDFSAFFEAARTPQLSATAPTTFGVAPSSFLSLRYTGIVSSNMFFTASFTRSSAPVRTLGIVPVE
jgi:hypothetical protein